MNKITILSLLLITNSLFAVDQYIFTVKNETEDDLRVKFNWHGGNDFEARSILHNSRHDFKHPWSTHAVCARSIEIMKDGKLVGAEYINHSCEDQTFTITKQTHKKKYYGKTYNFLYRIKE